MDDHQVLKPRAASLTNGKVRSLNPFDQDFEDGISDHVEEASGPPKNRSLQQLEEIWNKISVILCTSSMDPFAMEELRELTSSVEKLLIKDVPEAAGQIGPCLRYVLSENIVEGVYMFSTRQKVYAKEIRIMLLRFFAEVLTRSPQPILIHQQILRPISKLLRACEGTSDRDVQTAMVPLLHAMCILMQENQSLLDLFFIESQVHMQSRFLVFTQLIPHLHAAGEVGNRARDAILLCLSLADQLPASNLTHFIGSECNFCQVLATGLSALYSDLPSTRDLIVDEWQSPLPVIADAVPELHSFIQALDFCNSVLQMAPQLVCNTMLALVKEGFLQQVMGAALMQSSDSAVMFATAYTTIFLQNITNVALMRAFLCHLLLGSYDNRSIINSLSQNISKSNHLLCAVTLELFTVLLNLNCEDVVLELVLKHLLPGTHIMPNQLAIVGAPDVYSQAARKLLQLLPLSCITAESMFLDSLIKEQTPQPQDNEHRTPNSSASPSFPPEFTSTPLSSSLRRPMPTPSSAATTTTTTTTTSSGPLTNLSALSAPPPSTTTSQLPQVSTNPFDDPLPTSRSRSGSDASSSSLVSMCSISSPHTPASGIPPVASGSEPTTFSARPNKEQAPRESSMSSSRAGPTASGFQFEHETPEMVYFQYLAVSRAAIRDCIVKCRCWSSVYDKCEVSKESLKLTQKNVKFTKSLEMEDISSVKVHVTSDEENSSVGVCNGRGEENGGSSFRSRATTLSSNTSKTVVLRSHHNKLHSRRAMVTRSQVLDGEESESRLVAGIMAYDNAHSGGADDPPSLQVPPLSGGLRRSGTISGGVRPRRSPNSSPLSSPKFGRKIGTLGQYEDKTGLFLKVLMDKLMDMMDHPPSVNILMTRLVSRLATYPQPLLRSLLLNHQLVLKPGVPNLMSVLQYLKQTVDRYARTQEGFEKRLGRARKTMIYREMVRNQRSHGGPARPMPSSSQLRQTPSRPELDVNSADPPTFSSPSVLNKRTSKTDLSLASTSSKNGNSQSKENKSEHLRESHKKKKSKKVSTDTLYAVMIFYEFLKELASISEEHSVLHSLLYLPNPTSVLLDH